MSTSPPRPEPENVLYRIQRGLAGYVSYLAACEMNEAFSEYVLYEPMLRILTARGFTVKCESDNTGLPRRPRGETKKMDFEATAHGHHLGIEVKWARQPKVDVANDVEKLASFLSGGADRKAFLCVFGVLSAIQGLQLSTGNFHELGKLVWAEFGITRYGCRVYQLQRGQSVIPRPRPGGDRR